MSGDFSSLLIFNFLYELFKFYHLFVQMVLKSWGFVFDVHDVIGVTVIPQRVRKTKVIIHYGYSNVS